MNKKHYAQLLVQDSVWEEDLSVEELNELKENHQKLLLKQIKQPRSYKSEDGVSVILKSFQMCDLFEVTPCEDGLAKEYDKALNRITERVRELGMLSPLVVLPYSLLLTEHFPNRLQIIELESQEPDGCKVESLVVARVTDTFDGIIEKEIHDIVSGLDWKNITNT